MPCIVQYGAGNIGRSLVGQIFSKAGWEVLFIDVVPEIIDALNQHHSYQVIVKDDPPEEILVSNVSGILASKRDQVINAIVECDLMATAVGPAILPQIAPVIAESLVKRSSPLNIILCENLRGAPEIMGKAIQDSLPCNINLSGRLGLVASSIGKMVPIMPYEVRQKDPLLVWAEAYNKIIADREAFIGTPPDIPGLELHACFNAYVDRKLFVHNLGHVIAAYLGNYHGVHTIPEAMELPTVADMVSGAMHESGEALIRTYPQEFDCFSMNDHINDLCRRFRNRALGDTVFRVGRDRPRKFAPDDRLVGAIRLQQATGINSKNTLEGIAAGLYFSAVDDQGNAFPADVEFDRIRNEKGILTLLSEVCGFDQDIDKALIEEIIQRSKKYKR